jgi:hypothetical protein
MVLLLVRNLCASIKVLENRQFVNSMELMIATNSQTNVPHLNAGEIANLTLVAANRVAVFH